MKEVGKIYSAVDADELEAGDIVDVGDTLSAFKRQEEHVLTGIGSEEEVFRFESDGHKWALAKLICPKKHAEVYKA